MKTTRGIPITPQQSQGEGPIRISRGAFGRSFRLEASQFLPCPRDELFALFSDAFELENLTPTWLHFSVITPLPIAIGRGTLIDYRLRVHGLPLRWQSLISDWQPPLRFVDEQTRGPFRRWRHEHSFEAVKGGNFCRDIVDYSLWGGWLVHALLARRDLLTIFRFRQNKLRERFSASCAWR
jgi:ligand-binding SRPBCC domain-containing protein